MFFSLLLMLPDYPFIMSKERCAIRGLQGDVKQFRQTTFSEMFWVGWRRPAYKIYPMSVIGFDTVFFSFFLCRRRLYCAWWKLAMQTKALLQETPCSVIFDTSVAWLTHLVSFLVEDTVKIPLIRNMSDESEKSAITLECMVLVRIIVFLISFRRCAFRTLLLCV